MWVAPAGEGTLKLFDIQMNRVLQADGRKKIVLSERVDGVRHKLKTEYGKLCVRTWARGHHE